MSVATLVKTAPNGDGHYPTLVTRENANGTTDIVGCYGTVVAGGQPGPNATSVFTLGRIGHPLIGVVSIWGTSTFVFIATNGKSYPVTASAP